MVEKEIYHLNDRTLKYLSLVQSKRQHQHLKLPGGEFKTRLPQEIVFPTMDIGRVDEYYLTTDDLLIDLEEESGEITDKTKEKFSKYVIFASYIYLKKTYLAVICHKNPKKEWEFYEYSPSLHIKIHYIFFSQDELWQKYEKIINKVRQKEELTEMEALDIAFVSKYISKEYAPEVVESLTEIFNDTIIEDKLLKMDVGVILGGMILKHVKNEKTRNKLLEKIGMRHIETEIEKLVYDEFGDKLDEKDNEINEKDKEIEEKDKTINEKDKTINEKDKEIEEKDKTINKQSKQIDELNNYKNESKNKIKELNEMDDLNPKAKQIIQSMLLL